MKYLILAIVLFVSCSAILAQDIFMGPLPVAAAAASGLTCDTRTVDFARNYGALGNSVVGGSVTVGSTTNRYLVVWAIHADDACTWFKPDSAKYGTTALIVIDSVGMPAACKGRIDIWGLANPTTATADVIIWYPRALADADVCGGSFVFSGASQSTPTTTAKTTHVADDGKTITQNITAALNDSLITIALARGAPTETISANGAGQTTVLDMPDLNAQLARCTTAAGTGSAQTQSFTLTPDNQRWEIITVAIKPAP